MFPYGIEKYTVYSNGPLI